MLRFWQPLRSRSLPFGSAASRPSMISLRLEQLEDRLALSTLSATTPGSVYVISADNAVWEHNVQSGWFALSGPGFAASIDACQEDSGVDVVYAVTPDHVLYEYTSGTGWNRLGGDIADVSCGIDAAGFSNVFVITTANQPAQFDPTVGWAVLGGPGTILSLHAADGGLCYFIGADHSVLEYNPSGWFVLTSAGFADELSAVTDSFNQTEVFALTPGHQLFEYQQQFGWLLVGADIGVLDAAGIDDVGHADVFAITLADQPAEFDSQFGWTVLGGPGTVLEQSAADPASGPGYNVDYVITHDHAVYEHLDQGWFPLTDSGFALG